MSSSPTEQTIQQVCQHVLRLVQEQSLPDDDLLHYSAASQALNTLGVDCQRIIVTINFCDEGLDHVQSSSLLINGQGRDLSGHTEGGCSDLEVLRARYLVDRYGMKDNIVDYAAVDVLDSAAIAERWGDFSGQVDHLASQVVALVRGQPVPPPLPGDPEGSLRSGPLARARYATKINQLVRDHDAAGLSQLLTDWQQDLDLDRPANLPQQLAYALARARSDYDECITPEELVDMMKQAKQYGADLHYEMDPGFNLVYEAVQMGHLAIVKYLVQEEGVSIDPPVSNLICKVMPLSHAILNDRPEMTRFLIDNGADTNRACSDGETPLCSAARRGMNELMDEFLSKGADINVHNQQGENLLHMICGTRFDKSKEKIEMALRLLGLGVPADEISARGKLPYECLGNGEGKLKNLLQYEWSAQQLNRATPNAVAPRLRRKL